MNGLLDNQTSGNDWGVPVHAMLHERSQNLPFDTSVSNRQRSSLLELEAQMRQFERDHQTAITEVRKFYVLPTDSSVLDFLNEHRALPQVLIDAAPQLGRYFGDTVFALRATSDEDGWQNLYADALWPGDALDAIRLLDRFEDDWWIPNCRQAGGNLTFTYRLI